MSKELETLEPSVLLEFIDGLLKRYENKTDYNIYITKDWLLEIKKAIKRLESIDNANPSEALECSLKLYKMVESAGNGNGFSLNEAWKYHKTIIQALLKAEKEHNSVNLLMQELDCKDFAELRKYARCGYEKLNNFKGSKEVKIEITESSLMDYNPVKHYLKWEDLDFDTEWKYQEVKLNGTKYTIKYKCDFDFFDNYYEVVKIYNQNERKQLFKLYNNKQFFNDLHLERVEE